MDTKSVPSSSTLFAMVPQTIGSLADLKTVLLYVDSLTVCLGNDDSKYEELITIKKGNFMNHSGMIDLLIWYFTFYRDKTCDFL